MPPAAADAAAADADADAGAVYRRLRRKIEALKSFRDYLDPSPNRARARVIAITRNEAVL